MLALLLTIAALSIGPLIHRLVLSRPAAMELLDAFTVFAVGGLVLLQVVPGTLQAGGWLAGLGVLLGVGLPVIAEGSLHRAADKVHRLFLVLAMFGIGLHALFDGVALADPRGDEHTSLLGIGVAIHSLPVGLMVSWLLLPSYGRLVVIGTIAFMVLCTVGGFVAAPHLPGHEGGVVLAVLQAFVAGSLVHVLAHPPHLHGPPVPTATRLLCAIGGSLAAVAVLGVLLSTHTHERAPLQLTLVGGAVLLVFLFFHYAPHRWTCRLMPWRHHHGHD